MDAYVNAATIPQRIEDPETHAIFDVPSENPEHPHVDNHVERSAVQEQAREQVERYRNDACRCWLISLIRQCEGPPSEPGAHVIFIELVALVPRRRRSRPCSKPCRQFLSLVNQALRSAETHRAPGGSLARTPGSG